MACIPFVVEDNSLDDTELWDFIDTTIARRSTHTPHSKPLLLTHHAPTVTELPPSPQTSTDARILKGQKRQVLCKPDSKSSSKDELALAGRSCLGPAYMVEAAPDDSPCSTKQRAWIQPQKMPRREEGLAVSDYRHNHSMESPSNMQRSHTSARFPLNQIVAHDSSLPSSHDFIERRGSSENRRVTGNNPSINDWMPSVPSATMFRHIQNAALNVLEKGDYVVMQGKTFIKKCGWRKIAFFFNISFEIKDRTIQFDEHNNVQRAEFIVRANMQSGRYSDGWGSCDRGEKRYTKPNHDIPSTAETRAKTRACQDLLGIGEYKGAGGGGGGGGGW